MSPGTLIKNHILLHVPIDFIFTFIAVLPTYYCNYFFTCLSFLDCGIWEGGMTHLTILTHGWHSVNGSGMNK